jgi:hypothetical protein
MYIIPLKTDTYPIDLDLIMRYCSDEGHCTWVSKPKNLCYAHQTCTMKGRVRTGRSRCKC